MEYSKHHVVEVLRHAGLSELADEASRTLPESIDSEKLKAWVFKHGISHDDLVSRLGGSP
jgi:hypothetical protein